MIFFAGIIVGFALGLFVAWREPHFSARYAELRAKGVGPIRAAKFGLRDALFFPKKDPT